MTREILARFDAELRVDPPPEVGVQYERIGPLVRTSGAYHLILFADLPAAEADAAIAEQAAHAKAHGQVLEWKVYGHDRLADLGQRLARAGFVPDESETLMVFDLFQPLPMPPLPPQIEVRRVFGHSGLEDFLAAGALAFEADQADLREPLRARLSEPGLALYVAFADAKPVAAGRMELPPSRSFASLWGGGTAPAWRSRGLYRALVAVRADEARRHGYRFLTVEARATSCPILERLGFRPLTTVVGWKSPPR